MRCLLIAASVATSACATAQAETPDETNVSSLAWLSGEWVGEEREGGAAEADGVARLYVTPPTDGVLSVLFTWNVPATGHVHNAVTIFRDDGDSVSGAGIHYGRDFETFEDHPWRFELGAMDAQSVRFDCVEHCRAVSVTYSILDDGRLEGRWRPTDDEAADWVETYERVR